MTQALDHPRHEQHLGAQLETHRLGVGPEPTRREQKGLGAVRALGQRGRGELPSEAGDLWRGRARREPLDRLGHGVRLARYHTVYLP